MIPPGNPLFVKWAQMWAIETDEGLVESKTSNWANSEFIAGPSAKKKYLTEGEYFIKSIRIYISFFGIMKMKG